MVSSWVCCASIPVLAIQRDRIMRRLLANAGAIFGRS
jgi:hypothetical protein